MQSRGLECLCAAQLILESLTFLVGGVSFLLGGASFVLENKRRRFLEGKFLCRDSVVACLTFFDWGLSCCMTQGCISRAVSLNHRRCMDVMGYCCRYPAA